MHGADLDVNDGLHLIQPLQRISRNYFNGV